ncbi:hypothetical protein P7K49_024229 [Saguinus oedipus]|uniref:Uncharacterized protein n=1 Tax=Saguinus oedipus TaxID=9490 RepID=A0ABQ9UNX8_SAGOE|nr:hypothetical protein P7K49_024229 [Saguinus oedipus]
MELSYVKYHTGSTFGVSIQGAQKNLLKELISNGNIFDLEQKALLVQISHISCSPFERPFRAPQQEGQAAEAESTKRPESA